MKEVTRDSIRIRQRDCDTFGARPVRIQNLAAEWDDEMRLTPEQMDDMCQAWIEMRRASARLHRPDRTEATGT